MVSSGGETPRFNVYALTYNQQKTFTNPYTNETYKVADQFAITQDMESMEHIVEDISFNFSEVITTEVSRFNIGIGAKIKSKNISAGVTFNHEMHKATEEMSNSSHVFAGSEKWWKIYDISAVDPSLVMAVDETLSMTLAALPKTISSDMDKLHYAKFINTWGTHFVQQGSFGGRMVHNVYVDTDFYMKSSQSWVSNQINLNFHWDAFNVSGGGFSNKSAIHMDQNYTQHSSSYLFFEGGEPTLQTNTSLGPWANSVPHFPHFLNSTLHKLSTLCDDEQVMTTLSGVIDSYMANPTAPEFQLP